MMLSMNRSQYSGLEPLPSTQEKVMATLSYGTLGIVGFILLLLRKAESRFLKYHIYQSILLGLLFLLLNSGTTMLLGLIVFIFSFAPKLQNAFMIGSYWLLNLLKALEFGLIIYCMITIWRNKYTWIVWVSAQIFKML
jgi:uncharacterized membrane protein